MQQNNLISWMLEDAPEKNRTVEDFAARILTINFAAIHTTSHVSCPELILQSPS